ncbi:MAG: 2Fe-2S iron-sulfur cluster-binding protein, partial [Desulfatiglandales bacterium]|nr:2Fe-2S iron-sulfur cluster-binding protein [Desulfatiglandales bacterium]
TIEGMSVEEDLDALQESFIQHGAVQCGFCSPGMLLTAKELLGRVENPTVDQIKEAISGNVCRCTGYTKIIEAIRAVK